MIAAFFDRITRLSLRFRWVTVGIAVLVLAALLIRLFAAWFKANTTENN